MFSNKETVFVMLWIFFLFYVYLSFQTVEVVNDDESCEICKLVATELDQVLDEDSTQVQILFSLLFVNIYYITLEKTS